MTLVDKNTAETKYLIAQLGARMHYAVPRILHEAGQLGHFYTDICATKGWPRLLNIMPESRRPDGLRRLLGRVPQGVPSEKITSFSSFGWQYAKMRSAAKSLREAKAVHLWAGKTFNQLILARGLDGFGGVYTFNSAGLELLQAARKAGLRTIMEQTIAPYEIERKLLKEEHEKWPGWEPPLEEGPEIDAFIARERAEWVSADKILCGSEFVKDSIAECNGPAERCVVVPYGVDTNKFKRIERTPHGGPLRVLTIGGIGLRKGSPYVLEAAMRLKGKAVFRMVGSIGVSLQAEMALRKHVELAGVVPRCEILKHYDWADVFLLPSICEGSATVTYEAMAMGIPVICTPNTGSIVGENGMGEVIDVASINGIVSALEKIKDKLVGDSEIKACVERSYFSIDNYSQRLVSEMSAPSTLTDSSSAGFEIHLSG